MRIFLAPMEGVVDHHMRYIMAGIGGVDFCVTEFIRITEHTLPRRIFIKYCPELLRHEVRNEQEGIVFNDGGKGENQFIKYVSDCPTRIQLLGSDPHILADNARKAAKLGAIGIDLNFGCPAKTVNRNRGGACLLNETPLIYEIVSRVREAVPADIPVTAKIRLGFDDRSSSLDNATAIEKAGANELFVHARSKADGYNPPAYWSYIGEINKVLTIPVIANGEIWDLDDYKRCREQSNSQDFMLGRGLLAQPDLALMIKAYQEGRDFTPITWGQLVEKIHQFFLMSCEFYPKKHMGNRLKQWLFYLQRNFHEAERLFETIKRLRDFEQIEAAIVASVNS